MLTTCDFTHQFDIVPRFQKKVQMENCVSISGMFFLKVQDRVQCRYKVIEG